MDELIINFFNNVPGYVYSGVGGFLTPIVLGKVKGWMFKPNYKKQLVKDIVRELADKKYLTISKTKEADKGVLASNWKLVTIETIRYTLNFNYNEDSDTATRLSVFQLNENITELFNGNDRDKILGYAQKTAKEKFGKESQRKAKELLNKC